MSSLRRFDPALTGSDFREFSYRLMSVPGFLPDIYKDMSRMLAKYNSVMAECCQPWALVDGHNQIGGVFFVSDIEPSHQGQFYCWIWKPGCYTVSTHGAMESYLSDCAMSNQLDRISCRTWDDKHLGRLLERLGFKLEGRFSRAWKSAGRLSNLYCYRRLF